MSVHSVLQIYLESTPEEGFVDFHSSGDMSDRNYTISQKLPKGKDQDSRVIAKIEKESPLASASSFFQALLTDDDTYFVTIEPGADSAFVVALAILCDKFFSESNDRRDR